MIDQFNSFMDNLPAIGQFAICLLAWIIGFGIGLSILQLIYIINKKIKGE